MAAAISLLQMVLYLLATPGAASNPQVQALSAQAIQVAEQVLASSTPAVVSTPPITTSAPIVSTPLLGSVGTSTPIATTSTIATSSPVYSCTISISSRPSTEQERNIGNPGKYVGTASWSLSGMASDTKGTLNTPNGVFHIGGQSPWGFDTTDFAMGDTNTGTFTADFNGAECSTTVE